MDIDLTDPMIYRDIILLYCPKKVGSTSLVSSIRLSASDKYHVFHTHDEDIFTSSGTYKNLTVHDIFKNTCIMNKLTNEPRKIYVIDIFRTPIERKISEYFEEVCTIHFNNIEDNLVNYSLNKITERFNNIFPYISNQDYYREIYNIPKIEQFDFENKYLIYSSNNVTCIKLRLNDSDEWSNILTKILGTEITIVKDYETTNKKIGLFYEKFKKEYKIPYNLFKQIEESEELKFYYNDKERTEYLNKWLKNIIGIYNSFTPIEYNFYKKISLDNQFYDIKKSGHYFDDGCVCTICSDKRKKILSNIKMNIKIKVIEYCTILHDFDSNPHSKIFVKCFYPNSDIIDMVYNVI